MCHISRLTVSCENINESHSTQKVHLALDSVGKSAQNSCAQQKRSAAEEATARAQYGDQPTS